MLLDLKKVFLTENEKSEVTYFLDLTQIELDGIKPIQSPSKVFVSAQNRAGVVKLIANLQIEYARDCDRCSTVVSKILDYTFKHTLVVSLNGDSSDNYVETPDYKLELDELITSDVILELPHKFLCSEDCKGLCSMCGVNLNQTSCDCNKRPIDSRLEALKELLN